MGRLALAVVSTYVAALVTLKLPDTWVRTPHGILFHLILLVMLLLPLVAVPLLWRDLTWMGRLQPWKPIADSGRNHPS